MQGDPSNCPWLVSGIERNGNWSWKSLFVWGLLAFVWFIKSSLHLESPGQIKDKPFLSMVVLLSMVRGSPPIQPASRYQMFRLALTLDVTSEMAKVKRAGSRGSPCFTPVAESRLKFLEINQNGFFGADTDAAISTIHGPIADTDNQYF